MQKNHLPMPRFFTNSGAWEGGFFVYVKLDAIFIGFEGMVFENGHCTVVFVHMPIV